MLEEGAKWCWEEKDHDVGVIYFTSDILKLCMNVIKGDIFSGSQAQNFRLNCEGKTDLTKGQVDWGF